MRALRAVFVVVLLVLAGGAVAPSGATADPTWAPAATAAIHPGTMMYTDGAQCTANFVYTDTAGNVYVGYAAHCAGKGPGEVEHEQVGQRSGRGGHGRTVLTGADRPGLVINDQLRVTRSGLFSLFHTSVARRSRDPNLEGIR